MLPFQTPISVSRSFTFSLLAHRISKSLSHPDLTWRILHFQLLLSKTYSSLFGIAPTPVPFFSFLAIPSQSCRYSLPGLGHCPYPAGFDFSFPLFSALGAGLLLAA